MSLLSNVSTAILSDSPVEAKSFAKLLSALIRVYGHSWELQTLALSRIDDRMDLETLEKFRSSVIDVQYGRIGKDLENSS